MDFSKAREYLKNGGRITHPSFNIGCKECESILDVCDSCLRSDNYIRIVDSDLVLLNGKRINLDTSLKTGWIPHPDDIECDLCGITIDKKEIGFSKYDKDTKKCPCCLESDDRDEEY